MLDLPQEARDIVDGLQQFVRAEVLPRHEAHAETLENPHLTFDRTGRHSAEVRKLRREIRTASARAGYYSICVPEDLGGGGEGALTSYAIWEALHRQCGMKYWLAYDTVSHWASGPSGLLRALTPALTHKILEDVVAGQKSLCFGMSEPDAGTDIWRMRTRAEETADGWRINGTKQWITNGPYADYAIIFAVTNPEAVKSHTGGISAFLIPTDTPGYRVDSVIRLFGHAGGNEAILSLTDVQVSQEQLLGERDRGLQLGLSGIAQGRLYNAAKAVGLARWALEQALPYSQDRVTFGKKLFQHQAISFALAEAAMSVLPAHLLGLHAARLLDAGKPALMETAMAKAVSVEMSAKVLETSIQTMGGIGLTNELGLTQAWQDERVVHIADGSSQMQRKIIAGRLAAGDIANL